MRNVSGTRRELIFHGQQNISILHVWLLNPSPSPPKKWKQKLTKVAFFPPILDPKSPTLSIVSRFSIIGVVEMVNSRKGFFSTEGTVNLDWSLKRAKKKVFFLSHGFQPFPEKKERMSTTSLTLILLERFSIDYRKTSTKVITATNLNRSKQRDEPIRITSKYLRLGQCAGKIRVARSRCDWFSFCYSLVEKDFLANQ